jgi:sodium/potassium-transporting ATPase subunit alpha
LQSEPIDASSDISTESFLESHNIALQGSLCVSGSVTAVAILTGEKTVFGRIAKLTSRQSAARTTLEKEVLHFVLIISSLAAAVCLLVVILWAAWLRRSYPNFINVPTLLIDLVSVAVGTDAGAPPAQS